MKPIIIVDDDDDNNDDFLRDTEDKPLEEKPPTKRQPTTRKRKRIAPAHNPFVDYEAEVSGEEDNVGGEDDEERHGDIPNTQDILFVVSDGDAVSFEASSSLSQEHSNVQGEEVEDGGARKKRKKNTSTHIYRQSLLSSDDMMNGEREKLQFQTKKSTFGLNGKFKLRYGHYSQEEVGEEAEVIVDEDDIRDDENQIGNAIGNPDDDDFEKSFVQDEEDLEGFVVGDDEVEYDDDYGHDSLEGSCYLEDSSVEILSVSTQKPTAADDDLEPTQFQYRPKNRQMKRAKPIRVVSSSSSSVMLPSPIQNPAPVEEFDQDGFRRPLSVPRRRPNIALLSSSSSASSSFAFIASIKQFQFPRRLQDCSLGIEEFIQHCTTASK